MLLAKYLARFDQLIKEGEDIFNSMRPVHERRALSSSDAETGEVHIWPGPVEHYPDERRFKEWQTKALSVLDQVIRSTSVHRETIKHFSQFQAIDTHLTEGIAALKAIRDDLDRGFLGDISTQIEAEIAADYMGQAEGLLKEGQSGKYDHVPAAVLAGAVLEKGLRTLCGMQSPPVAMMGADGKPLMLNGLIDALKKAGTFNELTAKQLKAWADIRNKAAHGEFDQFKREDVELMLKGVNSFLAEQLK
jgi:hypothetical protein